MFPSVLNFALQLQRLVSLRNPSIQLVGTSLDRGKSSSHNSSKAIDLGFSKFMVNGADKDELRETLIVLIENYKFLDLGKYTVNFAYPHNQHIHIQEGARNTINWEYWKGSYTPDLKNLVGVTPVIFGFENDGKLSVYSLNKKVMFTI